MSSPFPPVDAATVAALNAGDESALERLVRSHYASLHERARERLKDEPAAAPRLVVAAMLELWQERARFKSGSEIEAFLNEELRNRASAVRSRMAAVHRFERTEGVKHATHAEPGVDQVWADLQASLHRPAVDPAAASRARGDHARHDAADHIAHVAERRSITGPAIAIALGAIVLVGAFWWMGRSSRETVIAEMLTTAEKDAVTTLAGQIGSLSLADGSTARLGAESRLVIVPEFGRKYRTVRVAGSASITVAPGNDVPFELRAGDAVATVGTAGGTVMVSDYESEPHRIISAEAGEVHVRAGEESRTLAAGSAVLIARDGSMREPTAGELSRAFGWTDGRLVLDNVPAGDAAKAMWRWYGMQVSVPDSAVAARPVSMDVSLESSQAALAAIETGANAQFAWVDGKMVIREPVPARGARRR